MLLIRKESKCIFDNMRLAAKRKYLNVLHAVK